MAEEIHHPHDLMVHAVLSDVTEASSFLQAYLPGDVSQELNWSTLRLVEGSFVDEALRGSEADLLYEVERVLSQDAVWLYILLEHQSTPDRWMRFRLLKYCCRIWDQSFRDQPEQRELRAIVPLVFYQGERRWTYSREFADLFAESVRDWPGVPRFAHELIDQSGMRPEEVQGELKGRLMQLVMLAAYHPTLVWMEQAARLLGSLSVAERSLPLLNLVEMLYQPRAQLLLCRWGQLQDHLHKAQRLKNGKVAPSVDNNMCALGAQLLKGNRLARLVGKASARLCVGKQMIQTVAQYHRQYIKDDLAIAC